MFMRRSAKAWTSVALVGVLLTQSGCHDWTVLSPVYANQLPSRGDRVTSETIVVQTAGGPIRVSRDFDLEVKLTTGQTYRFDHPVTVDSEIDLTSGDETVSFRGDGDGAPVRLHRQQIATLSLITGNGPATALAVVGITAGTLFVGLIVLLVIALANSSGGAD
jgi:hypothetical protein